MTADVKRLRRIIAERADGAPEELRCHWFDGDFRDAADDFCWDCAKKIVDEDFAAYPVVWRYFHGWPISERYRVIDGGWSIEHDHPPYCEGCGAMLQGSLTDYGVDEEIAALTGSCKPEKPADWRLLELAVEGLGADDPRWADVARVVGETADDAEGARP